jgi:HPt (histidine-containing phosphotransfer) domain-containing protein
MHQVPSVESVLDLAEAMANMDGDAELLREIVEIFLEVGEPQLDTIGQYIVQEDVQQVAIQAHAMKGGAANFCAEKFVAGAQQLETLAKNGSLDGAETMLAQMRADYAEIAEVAQVINWDEVVRSWRP